MSPERRDLACRPKDPSVKICSDFITIAVTRDFSQDNSLDGEEDRYQMGPSGVLTMADIYIILTRNSSILELPIRLESSDEDDPVDSSVEYATAVLSSHTGKEVKVLLEYYLPRVPAELLSAYMYYR